MQADRLVPNPARASWARAALAAAFACILAAPSTAHAQPGAPLPPAPQDALRPARPDPQKLIDKAWDLRDIGEYAYAARLLSEFASRFPRREEAPDALQDAMVFQLALGLDDDAANSLAFFHRKYGRRKARQAGLLTLAYMRAQLKRNQYKRASKRTATIGIRRNRKLTPIERIEAEGLLGQAADGLGHSKEANARFKRVQTLFHQLPSDGAQTNDPWQLKQLGRGLTMVGQAHYRDAMKLYEEALKPPMPRYRGPRTKAAISDHIRQRIGPWMQRRHDRTQHAEKAFLKVVRIKPVPPPKWVIRSAARVAEMWLDTYHAILQAPVPPMSTKLRDIYQEQVDVVAHPLKMRARQALKLCIDYGAKYQSEAREVAACERSLAKLDPRTIALEEALLPTPRWRANPIRITPLADPRPQ